MNSHCLLFARINCAVIVQTIAGEGKLTTLSKMINLEKNCLNQDQQRLTDQIHGKA
jgi:hypothetical protein